MTKLDTNLFYVQNMIESTVFWILYIISNFSHFKISNFVQFNYNPILQSEQILNHLANGTELQ